LLLGAPQRIGSGLLQTVCVIADIQAGDSRTDRQMQLV